MLFKLHKLRWRWPWLTVVVGLWAWGIGCNPDLPDDKPCLTDIQCDVGNNHCVGGRCVAMSACRTQQQCGGPQFQCVDQFCRKSPLCESDADCTNAFQFCFQNYCISDQPVHEAALLYVTFDKKATVAGEVWDESLFARKGEWQGKGAQDTGGYRGEAGRFNGQDSYLVFASSKDFALKTMTVEAWIRPLGGGKESALVSHCDSECRNGYILRLNTNDQVVFQVATATDTFSCVGKSRIVSGVWTHVRGSYDGQKIRCFVNGVLEGSIDWSGTVTYLSSARVEIGGRSQLQSMFAGSMDEVALFPGADTKGSSPGLTRYLYVASKQGEILAVDTKIDRLQPDQSFVMPEAGWPVALSANGKFLFLWNRTQQTLTSVDMSTKSKMATVKVSENEPGQGRLVTYHHETQTLWFWGDTTYVFALPLQENATPKATFPGLGATFGRDVVWLASRGVFVVSDPEGRQLHHFDPKTLKKLDAFSFKNNPIDGEQPLALGINPDSGILYVSFMDSFEMQFLSPTGTGYRTVGSITTQENNAEGRKLDRQVARMVVHPRGEHIYYTFVKPGFIYRLDLKANVQYLIWEAPNKKQIPMLTTQYYPYLHHLGEKIYISDGNKGTLHVVGTQSHKIEKSIVLGKETADAVLPLVGVLHTLRAY